MITVRQMKFFSPFETGTRCRIWGSWKWYHDFLVEHPNMVLRVESDTWDCLIIRGLVTA
jgi:hypothetical protein